MTIDLIPPSAPAWFRYRSANATSRLGVVAPRGAEMEFFDLGALDPATELERGTLTGAALREQIARALRIESAVCFEVPLPRPSKILCLGRNFAAHAAEFGAEVPEEPIVFTKFVDTLLPHRGTIVLPHWVESRIDHEVELAVVIGGLGPHKYVAREAALEIVAGYSVFNDVTARRMQGDDRDAGKPWLRSKSFDTFGPFGPWVVPADSIDLSDAAIELQVNGDVRQSSRLSLMVVGIADAIAYLSRHTTLRAGDIIAMGTPEGVGPLEPGDRVTCTIEGIGRLANDVMREER